MPGQAEAAKIQTGPGGLGALQAPHGAPETKHKPVMGAIAVFAWLRFCILCDYAYVKCTFMYAYDVDTPAM